MKNKKIIQYIPFTIKRFLNWIKNLILGKTSIFHRKGAHIISGYMGSGKTLLVSHLINQVDKDKYFFYSNLPQFHQENVQSINIWDLFANGKQVAKLPTTDSNGRKLYALILDEINLKFNKRINNTKNYNDSFIGLIELIITCRHQGINRIYFIGQKLELQDTQLQSLFKYWHNITANKQKAYFEYYLKDKSLVYAPKMLYIENYQKYENDEYLPLEVAEVKINYSDLESYNTFGMKELYDKLPYLI